MTDFNTILTWEVERTEYTYEPHIMEDPMAPFIFHTDTVRAFPRGGNWHENPEFLLCLEGSGTVTCDAQPTLFCAGDLFTVAPNRIHSFGSDSVMTYHCLIVDREFLLQNGLPMDRISLPEKIRDETICKAYLEIPAAMQKKGGLSRAEQRSAVLRFLVLLFGSYGVESDRLQAPKESESAKRVRKIISFLHEHLTDPLTLDSIAEAVSVSKFTLAREFKLYTGRSVFSWINRERCKAANRLLRDGMSVSAAASASGFSNLSYFSRTYEKQIGTLPSKTAKEGKQNG